MIIKHSKEDWWKTGLANNQDFYGLGVYTFAERWADLMENDVVHYGDPEKAIAEKAKERSHEADTEGITGFQYGAAVSILSEVWEYGDILRKWHNGEYNYDGDGVVNPAILTVK